MAKIKIYNKILGTVSLEKAIKALKKQRKKIVFTNGCFDILHRGHVNLFIKAKSLGDYLVVAVNSDSSLRRLKGPGRPLVPQKNRAFLIAALSCVDYVVIFNEDTPARIIKKLRPDILVKGGDYRTKEIVGRRYVKKVVRFPLVKGQSTTELIKRIVKRYPR